MDDKKKIIILAVAVIVAIGLVVLIIMARRGETPNQPALPSAPSSTAGGKPSGTGQPSGAGGPGQAGNAPGAAPQPTGTPNAFLPKPTPTEISGFTRTAGGVYVAPGTPQPQTTPPPFMSISKEYLMSQIAASGISLGSNSGTINSQLDLLYGTGGLPPALQKLMQQPGGPTAEDILNLQAEFQTEYDALTQKFKQFQNLNSNEVTPAQCDEIINEVKKFASTWGDSTDISSLGQIGACPTQSALGLPFGITNP